MKAAAGCARALVAAAIAAAAVSVAACAGEPPAPAPVEADLGGLHVRVEAEPARLVVTAPDGAVLLDGLPGAPGDPDPESPPRAAAAWRSAGVTVDNQFGAFKFEEVDAQPWRGVVAFDGAHLDESDGRAIRFALRDENGTSAGDGVVAEAGDGELTIELSFAAGDRASFGFGCRSDEHFLGFGGQSFDVDHRGQTVPLWVQEDGISKSDEDFYDGAWFLNGRRHSTHTPMPLYLSSRGYALLLDTPYRSVFAMCSEAADAVRVEAWEPALRLRLVYGPTPAAAVARLTARLGRPALPPRFAFAPWLDALYGSANVRRVAAALRAADVPASVIWTEDWRGAGEGEMGYVLEEDWELDRALYPDFEAVAADLHAAGFKFLTYENSFLDSEAPVYQEATAGDYTIHDGGGAPYLFNGSNFHRTSLVDFSNPDAVAWTEGKYREGLTQGADGYMADFAEWLPVDAVLASGDDAMARHNLYPVEWARLNQQALADQEAQDGVERLFFLRAAYLGSQPLVSVVWAGDQQTDFSLGDGMPSVIPIGIGLGIAGFPYFGHDIGGYMSELTVPTTRELWFRWVTLGALSPVMRTHHGRSARDNWSWESDAESTAHLRRWARLHMQLFPYLYALARDAAETGAPMMRPLAFDHPELEAGWTRTDEFALGDRLVVAPVIEEGATARQVELPAGRWFPLDAASGPAVDGGGAPIQVDAPVEEIPVFVPAGAVLVLLPDTVDTLVDAEPAEGLVTLADIGDDREIRLWPGGASTLVETSGISYEWTQPDRPGEPPASATWRGDSVPVTPSADGAEAVIELTGAGTLELSDGGRLVVTGGAADRRLLVRLRVDVD